MLTWALGSLVVEQLQFVIERNGLTWCAPNVCEEEQEISWWRVDRALIVAVDDGDLYYLQVRGPNMWTDMDEDLLTPEDFVELWKWLYS